MPSPPRAGLISTMREMSVASSATMDNEAIDVDEDDEFRILTATEVTEFRKQQNVYQRLRASYWTIRSQGVTLTCGTLKPDISVECHNGSFFYIRKIMSRGNETVLLGNKIVRNRDTVGRHLRRFVPANLNEICVIMKDVHKGRSINLNHDDSLETMQLGEVKQLRTIIFTNRPFPELRDRHIQSSDEFVRECAEKLTGLLICRKKYIEEVEILGDVQKPGTCKILSLREEESSPGQGMSDVVKSRRFHGKSYGMDSSKDVRSRKRRRELGTPQRANKRHITDYFSSAKASSAPLLVPTSLARQVSSQKKYTYGDICCGAGGNAQGAKMAGLEVKWGVDNCEMAYLTFVSNHGSTGRGHFIDVTEFCELAKEKRANNDFKDLHVDVMHLSFPCQGLSRANTKGSDEEKLKNNVLVTALGELLKVFKPRRVTLEQTDHSLTSHGGMFFQTAIDQLTNHGLYGTDGYSVGYKVLNSLAYGVPSNRKRLIIVAACPGETLPSFPEATYGPNLQPHVTLHEVLAAVPQNATHHDVVKEERAYRENPINGTPADGNTPLAHIIMCAGVRNLLHPNGRRGFTQRELAAIQGFPHDYEFVGKLGTKGDVRRQIGNAVPVLVAKRVQEEVVKSLIIDDAADAAYTPEIIELD